MSEAEILHEVERARGIDSLTVETDAVLTVLRKRAAKYEEVVNNAGERYRIRELCAKRLADVERTITEVAGLRGRI
jgi:DNA polymerase II large subunit